MDRLTAQQRHSIGEEEADRSGRSIIDTLRDLELAEQSGMLRTKDDGSVEIG